MAHLICIIALINFRLLHGTKHNSLVNTQHDLSNVCIAIAADVTRRDNFCVF